MDNHLFFALMYKDKEILEKTITELKNNYGDVVSKSSEYDFDFTDHYEEEFGNNLKKTIILFNKKINNEGLKNIKLKIKGIETKFSINNKRKINIDPGYVNDKKVVLASFKKKRFKDDLGNNVFAHKVLELDNGKVKDFFHTFPDFKQEKLQKFLLNLRL
jgi:hypothetical protein